jgi:hypothetical protein
MHDADFLAALQAVAARKEAARNSAPRASRARVLNSTPDASAISVFTSSPSLYCCFNACHVPLCVPIGIPNFLRDATGNESRARLDEPPRIPGQKSSESLSKFGSTAT